MKATLAGWLTLVVLGCPGLSGAASGEATGEQRRFEIRIQERQVVPDGRLLRVTRGERVALVWTTDEPVRLHLHGYDLEFEVAPGAPVTREFVAHATGRFPVTSHGFSGEGHGHETLLYLEVYPE